MLVSPFLSHFENGMNYLTYHQGHLLLLNSVLIVITEVCQIVESLPRAPLLFH